MFRFVSHVLSLLEHRCFVSGFPCLVSSAHVFVSHFFVSHVRSVSYSSLGNVVAPLFQNHIPKTEINKQQGDPVQPYITVSTRFRETAETICFSFRCVCPFVRSFDFFNVS
ncbi:hypothetical protein B0T09DRAFT_342658 [Sordaria sp. MPI-SDFR-AT-0083]|nr:hypothetical protein B0T09DRAFT_342658 [Sordaria sp. MPI-SDFR-AT-0083]